MHRSGFTPAPFVCPMRDGACNGCTIGQPVVECRRRPDLLRNSHLSSSRGASPHIRKTKQKAVAACEAAALRRYAALRKIAPIRPPTRQWQRPRPRVLSLLRKGVLTLSPYK
jgi:hypothetical protein